MNDLSRVLIVDDRREYLDALARALKLSFDVMTATSVDEAQSLLAEKPRVMLALVDICLKDTEDPSDRSGLTLIQWIAQHYESTPIVAMSALDDPLLPEATREAGACRFLRKPVRLDDLREIVAELAGDQAGQ